MLSWDFNTRCERADIGRLGRASFREIHQLGVPVGEVRKRHGRINGKRRGMGPPWETHQQRASVGNGSRQYGHNDENGSGMGLPRAMH